MKLNFRNFSLALTALALASVASASFINQSGGRFIPSSGGGGSGWWSTESTKPDVVFANRFNTQGAVDTYAFQDGFQPRLPTFDNTEYPPDSSGGSLRFEVQNSDTTGAGLAKIPFGVDFVEGDTFYVLFRYKAPLSYSMQPRPTTEEGPKIAIVSHTQGSNQTNEFVIQNNFYYASITGYHRTGNAQGAQDYNKDGLQVGVATGLNGTDFREPSGVNRASTDHDAAFVIYPLTGNNPDTGSTWSTADQDRAKYGALYGAYSNPGVADYRRGLGDPISGAYRYWPEWITIIQRIQLVAFGDDGNRWTVWAERQGGQPYLLWDLQNTIIGVGQSAINAIWPNAYQSLGQAGGRQITGRTNNIGGVTLITCGLSTPIGDGTLEYNATTQRFRWKGSGESYGTARGFSVANGKVFLNVISTGDSYVIAYVTNAGALPSSGTVEDTVTIADGRPTIHSNYADFMVSRSAIETPNGNTLVLP